MRAYILFLFLTLVACEILALGIFFNVPPNSGELKSRLLDLINSAQSTISIAIYNMNDVEIINALREKSSEGVNVRIVTEGKNYLINRDAFLGLNTVADPTEGGLMHEKFAVIDDTWVWVGSANFTRSSMYEDLNNALIFNSEPLSCVFNGEFNRVYNGYFSTPKFAEATTLTVEGMKLDVRFSPLGGIFSEIVDVLKDAKHEVDVAMFAFSDMRISLLLMALEERGVRVRVLADENWNSSKYSVIPKMREFNFLKDFDNPYGLLHDKYIIVDPGFPTAKVLTGSYNLTRSAQRKNNEVLIVIHSKKVAKFYLENFESLWRVKP